MKLPIPDKLIKIIYENCEYETKVSGDTITFTRKLTPMEIEELFGTTNIGIFDCSGMSDEELDQICGIIFDKKG